MRPTTHRSTRNSVSVDEDTRKILGEIHDSVDQLSPERARDVIDVLAAQYGA